MGSAHHVSLQRALRALPAAWQCKKPLRTLHMKASLRIFEKSCKRNFDRSSSNSGVSLSVDSKWALLDATGCARTTRSEVPALLAHCNARCCLQLEMLEVSNGS